MASPSEDEGGGIAAEISEAEREETPYGSESVDISETLSVDDKDVEEKGEEAQEEEGKDFEEELQTGLPYKELLPEEDIIQEVQEQEVQEQEEEEEEEIELKRSTSLEQDLIVEDQDVDIKEVSPSSSIGEKSEKEYKLGDVEMSEKTSEIEGSLTEETEGDSEAASLTAEEEKLINGIQPDAIRKGLSKPKEISDGYGYEGSLIQSVFGPTLLKELLPGLEEFVVAEDDFDSEPESDMIKMLDDYQGKRRTTVVQPADSQEERKIDTFSVLEADNSMMGRFQRMLEKHLLSQKERLQRQIIELESQYKRASEEIKSLGEEVATELNLQKQQEEKINNFKKSINMIVIERSKSDLILGNRQKDVKQLKTELTKKKKVVNTLDQEKDMVVQLLTKMESYKQIQDEQLVLNKMQTGKNKTDMKLMLLEKQKQDLILWRLTQIVLQMKRSYDITERNILAIRDTAEQIENNVTTSEVDMEGLKLENALIRQSINKAFEIVAAKNQAYPLVKEKFQYSKDTLAEVINQMRSINKSFEEIKKKEEKNLYKFRTALDSSKQLKNALVNVGPKIEIYEAHLADLEPILQYNETRLATAKKDFIKLEKESEDVIKKLNNELLRQQDMKTLLLGKLSESNIADGLKFRTEKQIKKLAKTARDQEVSMAEAENKLAKVMLEKELAKAATLEAIKKIQDLKRITDEKTEQFKAIHKKMKDKNAKIQNYRTNIAWRSKKIDEIELKDKAKQVYLNPLEVKIKTLEDSLNNNQEEIEKFENNWLIVQNEVLTKGDLRNKMITEVLKIRKDYTSVEQFRIRAEEKIAQVQFNVGKCNKELQYTHKQLERLEFETVEKAKLKEQLEKLAYIHEKKYEQDLKAAEQEYLDFLKANKDLEEINEEMTKQVKKIQKEWLEWDKKLKVANSEKIRVRKEMESTGEIGAMKIEIHRMEVRLSQLKKVQDKMMADLEHCISRRDGIIDTAEAREMKFRSGGKHVTRLHIERKLADVKMRVKQATQVSQSLNQDLEELQYKESKVQEENYHMNNQAEILKNGLKEIELQIHEGQIHKHACLEMTVLRQRKARFLDDLKYGRYRNVNKNEPSLIIEEEKQGSIHSSLEEILDALKIDFPHLGLQIMQIINSLKHPEKFN